MNENSSNKTCPKCRSIIASDAPGGLCPKCLMQFVAMSTDGMDFPIGDRLPPTLDAVQAAFPQLDVLELIGQGGMGAVYKARQPKLDRVVAIKILPLRLAREPSFAERFEREGRLLARLNHPSIVGVYDFGQTEGLYYLIMEFVDGVNLRQALNSSRFTPQEALNIIPKICEALQFAHDEGVLHRDIKPENILLDTKGRVKIADFGIAKFAGVDDRTGLTATGATIGTPHYMAPEQIERPSDVDHRADIFSLGVVFYEMLTGELPLGRFAAPSKRSDADACIDDVVMRALEKDRERRQQSANEVRTQVEMLSQASTAKELWHGGPSHVSVETTEPLTAKANHQAYSLRPTIALILVVASILLPISMAVQSAGPSNRLIINLAWVSAWFSIPGTLLGLTHLYYVRRSGNRHGLKRAVFASTFWPSAIAIGWCLFLVDGIINRMQPRQGAMDVDVVGIICLVMGVALTFLGMWAIKRVIERTPPDTKFMTIPTDPVFLTMKFLAGIAWILFGLFMMFLASRNSFPRSKPLSAHLNTLDWKLDIHSVSTKENVLILVVANTFPDSVKTRIVYRGISLLPKADLLASESYDGVCYFPGEQSNELTLSAALGPTTTLAFALPDPETAMACKNKIERLRGKEQAYSDPMTRPLFQINSGTFGEYEAHVTQVYFYRNSLQFPSANTEPVPQLTTRPETDPFPETAPLQETVLLPELDP